MLLDKNSNAVSDRETAELQRRQKHQKVCFRVVVRTNPISKKGGYIMNATASLIAMWIFFIFLSVFPMIYLKFIRKDKGETDNE